MADSNLNWIAIAEICQQEKKGKRKKKKLLHDTEKSGKLVNWISKLSHKTSNGRDNQENIEAK